MNLTDQNVERLEQSLRGHIKTRGNLKNQTSWLEIKHDTTHLGRGPTSESPRQKLTVNRKLKPTPPTQCSKNKSYNSSLCSKRCGVSLFLHTRPPQESKSGCKWITVTAWCQRKVKSQRSASANLLLCRDSEEKLMVRKTGWHSSAHPRTTVSVCLSGRKPCSPFSYYLFGNWSDLQTSLNFLLSHFPAWRWRSCLCCCHYCVLGSKSDSPVDGKNNHLWQKSGQMCSLRKLLITSILVRGICLIPLST